MEKRSFFEEALRPGRQRGHWVLRGEGKGDRNSAPLHPKQPEALPATQGGLQGLVEERPDSRVIK